MKKEILLLVVAIALAFASCRPKMFSDAQVEASAAPVVAVDSAATGVIADVVVYAAILPAHAELKDSVIVTIPFHNMSRGDIVDSLIEVSKNPSDTVIVSLVKLKLTVDNGKTIEVRARKYTGQNVDDIVYVISGLPLRYDASYKPADMLPAKTI